MKKLLLTAALMLGTTTLASAETKFINGCEVRKAENGNYYNRVDPTCSLTSANDGGTAGFNAFGIAKRAQGGGEEEEPTDPKS